MERAKIDAANAAIAILQHEEYDVIGIGSGSTVSAWLKEFNEWIDPEKKEKLKCVPTSYQAKLELIHYGFNVVDPMNIDHIDITVDGADEVIPNCICIKGGGGCHAQEMLIARMTDRYYIVVDYSKISDELGEKWKRGIPVEVLPAAVKYVKSIILKKLGGTCTIRGGTGKMGPTITDNGNFILDWIFDATPKRWDRVYSELKLITGVVEVGLFVGVVDSVLSADENGAPLCMNRFEEE